tara:strand:+ start:314 stop:529 length:216 start_codon:yes stop_codon:yes gene_type:complete
MRHITTLAALASVAATAFAIPSAAANDTLLMGGGQLAIPDSLRPAQVENGEIVEMEETELLRHLRRVNSDF